MKIFNWNLSAGVINTYYGEGRYFRILKGTGEFTLQVGYQSSNVHTQMIGGVGVDLSHPDTRERFKSLGFLSEVDQVITVLVSEFPTTDSRLTGDIDINGVLSVVNSGGTSIDTGAPVALSAAVAAEILPYNSERLKAMIQADADIYVGDSGVSVANGIFIASGSTFTVENPAQFYAISSGAATVRILEEVK